MGDDLPVVLTEKQQHALDTFTERFPECSWLVERKQGTGVRYWRFTYTMHPDWRGDVFTIQSKAPLTTFKQGHYEKYNPRVGAERKRRQNKKAPRSINCRGPFFFL